MWHFVPVSLCALAAGLVVVSLAALWPSTAEFSATTESSGTSFGAASSFAVGGVLSAAGANTYGQLGLGTSDDLQPVRQSGSDSTWASLSVGDSHACGLRAGGTLWC